MAAANVPVLVFRDGPRPGDDVALMDGNEVIDVSKIDASRTWTPPANFWRELSGEWKSVSVSWRQSQLPVEGAERIIWRLVVSDSLDDFYAYLRLFPRGAHARDAHAAIDRLKDAASQAEAERAREEQRTAEERAKERAEGLVVLARDAENRGDLATALAAVRQAEELGRVSDERARIEIKAHKAGEQLMRKAASLAKMGKSEEAESVAADAEKLGVQKSPEFVAAVDALLERSRADQRARIEQEIRSAQQSAANPGTATAADALPPGVLRAADVNRFLMRKRPCAYWMVPVHLWAVGEVAGPSVVCIWDGTGGAGTIGEVKGCMLGWYNVERDTYRPFLKDDAVPVIPGKKCSVATAMQLLNSRPWPAAEEDRAAAVLLLSGWSFREGGRIDFGGAAAVDAFVAALRNQVCPVLSATPLARRGLRCP